MPEMGESVTEGTVLEWHVAGGRAVAEGDTVIEVSTDKVDAEVPAARRGTITKLLVKPDDVVQVGQALAEMAGAGDGAGAAAAAAAPRGGGRGGARESTPPARPRRSPGGSRQRRASTWARSRARAGRQGHQGDVLAAADGGAPRRRPPQPPARQSRCAAPRRCSPRR